MKNHILIIEDEKDLLSTLQYNYSNFYTYPKLGGK